MNPMEISQQESSKIIDKRNPLGLFYVKENDGTFTGIDNSDGNAWVEEFEKLDVCLAWLRREIEVF
ncbi:hypothetical protein K0H71_00550 [Bacillus sp. IITD106]|nr:hypothetical protein [Bacillus sp. IITD106]